MNSKLIKILAVVGLAALAAVAHAQSADWTASPRDKTLSALVERWAQSEGRHAKWQAVTDFPISNADGLNRAADLSGATSMTEAVVRLLKTANTQVGGKDGAPGPMDIGYFVCFFAKGQVAVVIRSHGQPACGKS